MKCCLGQLWYKLSAQLMSLHLHFRESVSDIAINSNRISLSQLGNYIFTKVIVHWELYRHSWKIFIFKNSIQNVHNERRSFIYCIRFIRLPIRFMAKENVHYRKSVDNSKLIITKIIKCLFQPNIYGMAAIQNVYTVIPQCYSCHICVIFLI